MRITNVQVSDILLSFVNTQRLRSTTVCVLHGMHRCSEKHSRFLHHNEDMIIILCDVDGSDNFYYNSARAHTDTGWLCTSDAKNHSR